MTSQLRTIAWALTALLAGCERTIYVERVAPSGVAPIAIERPSDPDGAVGWWPALRPGKGNTLHLAPMEACVLEAE